VAREDTGDVAAYFIADETVTAAAQFDEYRKLAGPTLARYGARFLVRGGNPVAVEGDWQPKRVVVIEFESAQQAREWYDSPEYREAIRARQGAAILKFVLVEGA
jgi:uncharacterized protein (DUF1330 family)